MLCKEATTHVLNTLVENILLIADCGAHTDSALLYCFLTKKPSQARILHRLEVYVNLCIHVDFSH